MFAIHFGVDQFKVIILEHEIPHAKIFLDPSEIENFYCGHEGQWLEFVTARNIFHSDPELFIIGEGNRIEADFLGTMKFAEYLYNRRHSMTGHYPPEDKTNCNDCHHYEQQQTQARCAFLDLGFPDS